MGQGSSGLLSEELAVTWEPAAFPREIQQTLVLGRTSDIAGVSVLRFPISTVQVHVQRLSVIFISVYICLLFPQAELWSSGLDFHLA